MPRRPALGSHGTPSDEHDARSEETKTPCSHPQSVIKLVAYGKGQKLLYMASGDFFMATRQAFDKMHGYLQVVGLSTSLR